VCGAVCVAERGAVRVHDEHKHKHSYTCVLQCVLPMTLRHPIECIILVIFLLFSHFSFYFLYRVAKTHRMPYLHRSFSAEEPYTQWLLCGK